LTKLTATGTAIDAIAQVAVAIGTADVGIAAYVVVATAANYYRTA
jgi:hypothetical protein